MTNNIWINVDEVLPILRNASKPTKFEQQAQLYLESHIPEYLKGPPCQPNRGPAPIPHGESSTGIEPPHHPGVLLVHLFEDFPHHLHVVVPQLVGQSEQMEMLHSSLDVKSLPEVVQLPSISRQVESMILSSFSVPPMARWE